MYPEFPEDNKNEDFLNEFRQKIAEQSNLSFEERKNELNRSKSVFIGAVSGVVLAGIVGWFVLSPRYVQEGVAEVPVIRRPQTAIKVQPSEPGGMEILNQDKSVYGILDKKEENKKVVENLLPPPEEPKLPVIAASDETLKTDSTDVSKVADVALQTDVLKEAEKIVAVAEAPKSVPAQEIKTQPETKTLAQAIAEEKNITKETPKTEVKSTEVKKVEVKKPQEKQVVEKIEIKEDFLDLKIPAGVWQVQLMSSNNRAAVEKSWQTFSKKYPSLKNQPYEIETADLGAKGIYYRLKAGAFKAKTLADGLCNDIKALGGSCIVKKK